MMSILEIEDDDECDIIDTTTDSSSANRFMSTVMSETNQSVVELESDLIILEDVKPSKSLIICPAWNKKRNSKLNSKLKDEGKGRGSVCKQTKNPYYYIKKSIECAENRLGPGQRLWVVSIKIVSYE